jgi:hypothetical protein
MSKSKIFWLVCLYAVLILAIGTSAGAQVTYTTKLSSGPFLLAPSCNSLDWVVVNNDKDVADLRVTVYKLDLLGGDKIPLTPVTFSLEPGRVFHNANSFQIGYYYEVVVESTSDKVCPNVNQWSCNGGSCFIPGTLIPAGDFVDIYIKIKKDK